MSSGFDYALLDRILEAHDCAPRNTIAILQDVQEHYAIRRINICTDRNRRTLSQILRHAIAFMPGTERPPSFFQKTPCSNAEHGVFD